MVHFAQHGVCVESSRDGKDHVTRIEEVPMEVFHVLDRDPGSVFGSDYFTVSMPVEQAPVEEIYRKPQRTVLNHCAHRWRGGRHSTLPKLPETVLLDTGTPNDA